MAASGQQATEVKRAAAEGRGRRGTEPGRRVSFDSAAVGPAGAQTTSRRQSLWTTRRRMSRKSVSEVILLEPTYRMEPKVPFNCERTEMLVRAILSSRLTGEGRRRSSVSAAAAGYPADADQLALSITDEIRASVRDFLYDRYRLVVVVSVGDLAGGGAELVCASRCLWDPSVDVFAEATVSSAHVYAVAVIYAVYFE